ncbi:MAG: YgiT-type zinc finger protein [Pyrinomonadaceae bacterium]
MFRITACPTCGSKKIRRLRRDLLREYDGVSYVVPDLEYYECPECGERVYNREAMRKIENHSPAFRRTEPRKRKLA